MLRTVQHIAQAKPGLGVAQRAGLLVASSGPYHRRARGEVDRRPLVRLALVGSISALHIALTSGPQIAIERVVDGSRSGAPGTADEVNARRRAILLGNAAVIATGLVTQRVMTHSERSGPVVEVSRILGSQLAIGGAANALVLGTDILVGETGRGRVSHPTAAVSLGGLAAVAQSRVLKRVAPRLTLPIAPRTVTVPVRTRWRVHEVVLPLAR